MAIHVASTDEFLLLHTGTSLTQCLFLTAGEAVDTTAPHIETFDTYPELQARAEELGFAPYDPTAPTEPLGVDTVPVIPESP